ncbi:MAG: hypothetical protein BGO67_06750 [Alphaproteobacteria bacterium 41-28]|nr:MAG: hypothetical protein BGO67_06750 [Alphaproteobacteria bacterium 41-28]
MGVFKKYLYPFGFAMMLFSSSAMAKQNPTSFKGVTDCFKKDQEFYSPTLGEVALASGLIENIRFYGPFEAFHSKETGERNYTGDKSDDPLWKIVKILFPSNNGQLGTVTTAATNFGKYVTKPGTVALLLNYAKRVEDLKGAGNLEKKETNKFSEAIVETLEGFKEESGEGLEKELEGEEETKKSKETFRKKVINLLLNNIQESIKLEKQETSLYPRHTTEQVISAFFAYHFNTRKDIESLLQSLDKTIVDEEKHLSSEEDLLKEEDLPQISKKESPYTLDDVFNLTLADFWRSLTPYKAGMSLLNNGQAYFYLREKDTYVRGRTFADCVETAGRHIGNLLLFNPKTREFDLRYIREYSSHSPFFKNFEKFYLKQTPFLANAGDIGTRSLYNEVVGDLNIIQGEFEIRYVKGTNELSSGFINFIRVYQKVLELQLEELPQGDLKEVRGWVQKSLNVFFTALNPTYIYEINPQLTKRERDFIGDAEVIVKHRGTEEGFEREESLFSFKLISLTNHMEVKDLKILREKEGLNYDSLLEMHDHTLHAGTAEESTWLLASPDVRNQKIHHPFLQLFPNALSDNTSKIEFLEKLDNNYTDWEGHFTRFKAGLPFLQRMVENVLANIAWDDEEIVSEITPVIFSLYDKVEHFRETLAKGVKALKPATQSLDAINRLLQGLPNLESIDFRSNSNIAGDFSLPENLTSLRKLNFGGSKIRTLKGLENVPNLEELDLSKTLLKQLSLPASLQNLRKLNLSKSKISQIDGLENTFALEELDLSKTRLKQLSLPASLQSLRKLNLSETDISQIDGLENISALEELDLNGVDQLSTLPLRAPLRNLRKLNLAQSGISQIDGLENTPALEELDLNNIGNLEAFSLLWSLPNLRTLNLSGAFVSKIDGLENAPVLEKLYLEATPLTQLSFKEPLAKLRKLSLSGSEVSQIDGLENTPALEELDLGETSKLTKFSFTGPLSKLTKLTFKRSAVSQIDGLENTPALEEIDVSYTENLTGFSLGRSHSTLKKLNFSRSAIEQIDGLEDGLENTPALEELDLSHLSKLTKLSLPRSLENLRTLDLSNSGVSQIDGLENTLALEELNLVQTPLTKLSFTAPLEKLKKINLFGSRIQDLTGLEHLKRLKVLDLRQAKNITKLEFKDDTKELTLHLQGSGIGRGSIKGIEFLDEEKVFFD